MAFGHDVSLEPKWCYQDDSFLPSRLCSHCWLHFHSPLGSSLGSHPPRCLPAEKTAPFFNTCESRNHTDGPLLISQALFMCSTSGARKKPYPIHNPQGWVTEKRFTRGNSGCSDPEEEQMCDGWPKQSPAACGCLRQSWRNLWLPWGRAGPKQPYVQHWAPLFGKPGKVQVNTRAPGTAAKSSCSTASPGKTS